MYRYALSIIGGLFIGWNICLPLRTVISTPGMRRGGNFDPLLTLSQDELLRRLDSLVAERKEAIRLKLHRIDTYRNDLHKSRTPRDRYAAALHLYNEFQKFQLDSALRYSDRLETYARQLGDPQRINAARLIRCQESHLPGNVQGRGRPTGSDSGPRPRIRFGGLLQLLPETLSYHGANRHGPARCNANTDG